jgi:hypothetical protein
MGVVRFFRENGAGRAPCAGRPRCYQAVSSCGIHHIGNVDSGGLINGTISIVALEPDRKLKTNFGRDVVLDLSSRELECRNLYFPCS